MTTKERTNRLKKSLILVAILLMPGFLYFFLQQKGVNQYASLPHYGGKEILGKDTSWHVVPTVSLMNEEGKIEAVPARDTTVSVVHFFRTKCPAFCSEMNASINQLATRFSKSKMVRFYSISIDSSDHVADLSRYAARWSDFENWHFYAATNVDVRALSQEGYFLNALRDTSASDVIIHSSNLVLLDSRQHIRGYYDSMNPKAMEKLTDELRVLIAEERRTRK